MATIGSARLGEYEYDGKNRRIVKRTYTNDTLDDTYDYYFNQWQIVEVRKNGDTDPWKQYVWDRLYIDALLTTDYDPELDGTQRRIAHAHDANYNVVASWEDNGSGGHSVIERYDYTPYGNVKYLGADFTEKTTQSSSIDQEVLFAGYRLDHETGLYEVRNRMYHPMYGRWLQRDPAGYVDGQNLYEYVRSNPIMGIDPWGLYYLRVFGPQEMNGAAHQNVERLIREQLRNAPKERSRDSQPGRRKKK